MNKNTNRNQQETYRGTSVSTKTRGLVSAAARVLLRLLVDKRRIIKSPFPAGCGRGKAIATLIREALVGRAAQRARLILIFYLLVVHLDAQLKPFVIIIIIIIISGSACSTGGVHSQAWSTSGIGLGSKSGRG
jgi:hypothetical protein